MYDIYQQLLQKRGLTNYRVSKDTGISQTVLSAWKRGVSNPKADKMKIIADYLGVPVEYLVTGKMPGEIKEDDVIRSDQERKLLLSFRGAGKLTDEEYADLQNMFEATLDVYLKARGKKRQ